MSEKRTITVNGNEYSLPKLWKDADVESLMSDFKEASNEYVAYEPNRKITFKSASGPVRFEASYLFESTAGGTKLTSRIEMQAAGLFGFAEPLIAASLRREMGAAFPALKDLLENRVAAVSSGHA